MFSSMSIVRSLGHRCYAKRFGGFLQKIYAIWYKFLSCLWPHLLRVTNHESTMNVVKQVESIKCKTSWDWHLPQAVWRHGMGTQMLSDVNRVRIILTCCGKVLWNFAVLVSPSAPFDTVEQSRNSCPKVKCTEVFYCCFACLHLFLLRCSAFVASCSY